MKKSFELKLFRAKFYIQKILISFPKSVQKCPDKRGLNDPSYYHAFTTGLMWENVFFIVLPCHRVLWAAGLLITLNPIRISSSSFYLTLFLGTTFWKFCPSVLHHFRRTWGNSGFLKFQKLSHRKWRINYRDLRPWIQ